MYVTYPPVHVVVVTHHILRQLWVIEAVVGVACGALVHEEYVLSSEHHVSRIPYGALYGIEQHSGPFLLVDLTTEVLHLLHELQREPELRP